MKTPTLNILVVEDELLIAEHLRSVLEEFGHTVSSAAQVTDALDILRAQPIDLAFVDVMLRGDMDGIDLANRLRADFRVPFVFVTSLADSTTVARAKLTQPSGYLIKPFSEQEIYVALEMALASSAGEPNHSPARTTPDTDSIFVRDRKQLVKVSFADLLFLKADGNYTCLHLAATRYTVNNTLKQLEDRLPPNKFLRVHRSFVVAVDMVTAVDAQGVVIAGQQIPVGRAYHAALMSRLNLLGGAAALA